MYSGNSIDYLNSENPEADICFEREISFNTVLKEYIEDKKRLFVKAEDPQEKTQEVRTLQSRKPKQQVINIPQIYGKLSKQE